MRLIPLCHQLLREHIQLGDHVIDATAGGGHDSLFLAHCVGASGRVSAFDIQQTALEATRALLEREQVSERVDLHLQSHERMLDCLPSHLPVRAVMFNLGYLPGGDHTLVTRPESSLAALRLALGLILVDGVITIMVYPSHRGGREEYELLAAELAALPQREFTVMQLCCFNASAAAPQLWCIQKQAPSPRYAIPFS